MGSSREFAVELNNRNGFVQQLDVFTTYEEAKAFAETCDIGLVNEEYINIIFIDYDDKGNEIGFGSMC